MEYSYSNLQTSHATNRSHSTLKQKHSLQTNCKQFLLGLDVIFKDFGERNQKITENYPEEEKRNYKQLLSEKLSETIESSGKK